MIFQPIATKSQIRRRLHPSFLEELLDYLKYFVVVVLIIGSLYSFVRFFVFETIVIEGTSMFPYHQTKDRIYIDLLTPRFSTYRRGDVVVLIPPKNPSPECVFPSEDKYFIKRIIGLPGEQVVFEDGKVLIFNNKLSNQPIVLNETDYIESTVKTFKTVNPIDNNTEARVEEKTLGENEYYFMGDNRPNSIDSRRCGPIMKDQIVGKEFYRTMPIERRGFFVLPKYNISEG